MAKKLDSIKTATLELLRAGLATQSEIAHAANLHRQVISRWALQAGVNTFQNRQRHVKKIFEAAVDKRHRIE